MCSFIHEEQNGWPLSEVTWKLATPIRHSADVRFHSFSLYYLLADFVALKCSVTGCLEDCCNSTAKFTDVTIVVITSWKVMMQQITVIGSCGTILITREWFRLLHQTGQRHLVDNFWGLCCPHPGIQLSVT